MTFINKQEYEALQAFYAKIKDEFNVVKMFLFGSKARGDYKVYSDVDVLVLTDKEENINDFLEISAITADIDTDYSVTIHCLYKNYNDWVQERDNINPLLKQNVEREGVEIVLQ